MKGENVPEQQHKAADIRKSVLAQQLLASGLIDDIAENMMRDYFAGWIALEGDELTPSALHARARVVGDVMAQFKKLATEAILNERDRTDAA